MMQAQVVHVHISMATTITFMIHIVMKGKSPPSIMCMMTTNAIELKYENETINMKMLEMCLPTSHNKPYFTPSPNFMTIREDRETSTTKTEPLKWTLRRHLLRLKYTVIEHSSTSCASRPACISEPAT